MDQVGILKREPDVPINGMAESHPLGDFLNEMQVARGQDEVEVSMGKVFTKFYITCGLC